MFDFAPVQEIYNDYLFFSIDKDIQNRIFKQATINESDYIYLLYLAIVKDMPSRKIAELMELSKKEINTNIVRAEKLITSVLKNNTLDIIELRDSKIQFKLFNELLFIYEYISDENSNFKELISFGEHKENEKIIDSIIDKAEKIIIF